MENKRFRLSANGVSAVIWWGYIPDTLDSGAYYFKFSDRKRARRELFIRDEQTLKAAIEDSFPEGYELDEI